MAVLLERNADLAAAEALLADVVSTRTGRLTIVEGVPGVGKTELLRELGARARALGMHVAMATGGELERELAFGVARQLFVDDVAAHASMPASAALGLRDVTSQIEMHSAELDAMTGLFAMCAARAENQPVAVIVDDVHWADSASLKFLLYLVRRLDDVAVAVLLGARPAAVAARTAEIEELTDRADLTLKLETLSAASTAAVVRAWFGDSPSEAFTRVCVDTTGGNPLLLRQLLEEAAIDGLRPIDDDAARLRELGSTTVARAALLRASRLGQRAVDVAATAALIGRWASLPLVAAVAGVPPEDAELVVDDLVEAHLLKPGLPLRFVHPLVQSAIYRHMPRGLRSRRHRETARLLALAGAPDDEIGRHLLRTAPASDPWVRSQLWAAGKRALETGAPDVAIALLRRAVEEHPADLDSALLLQLGWAEALVRDPGALAHLQQAFDCASTPMQRAEAALPLARMLAFRRRWREALEALDAALATPEQLDDETLLRLRSERLWVLESSELTASEFAQEAEALAAGFSGTTPGERVAIAHLATAEAFRGLSHTRVKELTRLALGDGKLLREEGPESPTWLRSAALLWVVGDYADAERELLRGEQLAFDRGIDAPVIGIRGARAWMASNIGELARAEELARDVLSRTREPRSMVSRYVSACLATVLVEQGRLDEASEVIARVPPPTEPFDRIDCLVLNARAVLRIARGDAGGVDDLLTVGGWCDDHGISNPAEWCWRTDVAPALAANGNLDLARRLANEDLERARQFGAPRPLGRALHAAAVVGPPAERLALLEEAVQVLASCPDRLSTARAFLQLGVVRRALGQVTESQEPFRQALGLATACGATPVAEAARRLLLSTGARPRRTALIGPDALTPSEREVATLAAQGLTNREIATRLFVSIKAVEKHLRNSYAKLDIERRTELAAALGEEERQLG